MTIVEDLEIEGLVVEQVEKMLSSAAYAFSEDGSQLIVFTNALDIEGTGIAIEESLSRFTPHGMSGLTMIGEKVASMTDIDAGCIRK